MNDLITISEARANLPSLINKVSEGLNRFMITVNNKPKAVVMSVEELESLEETAEILSIPGALKAIKTGHRQAQKRKGITLEEFQKKYNL